MAEEEQGFKVDEDRWSLLKDWRVLPAVVALVLVLLSGAFLVLSNRTGGLVPGLNLAKVTPTPTQISTPPPLPTTTVFITNSGFVPEKLEAKLGTTLTFLNMTNGGFDIRSEELSELNLRVPAGQTKEVKLDAPGTYNYESSTSPETKGTIVVK